jgi:hypothetical protein
MRFPALEYLTLGVAVAPLAILAVRFQAGVRANLMQEDQFE